jgi:hypothetical protein
LMMSFRVRLPISADGSACLSSGKLRHAAENLGDPALGEDAPEIGEAPLGIERNDHSGVIPPAATGVNAPLSPRWNATGGFFRSHLSCRPLLLPLPA